MGRPFREGEVRVHHHGDEDAEINSKQLDSLTIIGPRTATNSRIKLS